MELLQSPSQAIAPDPFDRTIPEVSERPLQIRRGRGWLLLTTLARRSAPDAGMEVVVKKLALSPDRAKIGVDRWAASQRST